MKEFISFTAEIPVATEASKDALGKFDCWPDSK
jgi:hypothetical protein